MLEIQKEVGPYTINPFVWDLLGRNILVLENHDCDVDGIGIELGA